MTNNENWYDKVMLGLLIKRGAFLEVEDVEGSTPLHLAASSNCKDSVEVLLQNGADVNAIGKGGCTPLHLAVINGNTEIVELLLHKKADVHLMCFYGSCEGYAALDIAMATQNKKSLSCCCFTVPNDYIGNPCHVLISVLQPVLQFLFRW
ncbi:MAG: ankyrin repeat domain-containing protein [Wolbachia sp.]